MAQLPEMNEEILLQQLQLRYKEDRVYVSYEKSAWKAWLLKLDWDLIGYSQDTVNFTLKKCKSYENLWSFVRSFWIMFPSFFCLFLDIRWRHFDCCQPIQIHQHVHQASMYYNYIFCFYVVEWFLQMKSVYIDLGNNINWSGDSLY